MSSEQAGRVIVTCARGWQSLAATRSLGRRGVEVITADEVPQPRLAPPVMAPQSG